MSSIEKLKSIFSLEKKETIRKIRQKYFPLIAIGCITIQVFIAASYLDHNYPIDLTLLISSGCLLLVAAYFSFNINKNVNKEKFYIFFLYLPLVLIFLSVNLSFFKRDLVSDFLNLCFGYIILSVTILAVNATINRFFFSSGELEKTENEEKSVFDLENSKSSDEVENQKQTASLNYKNAVQKEPFSYIKKEQTIDEISSEFAVDVISVSLFFGIIFGTIAYLFFVPNKDISLFFGGIDIKTVAIATAGLVTFFWAAKAAKNKSIELEEKKQDGKRRDKEIKMAEARDTAQLIAKASELLGSENNAQKYAGLAFLNRVASQKGGPLQKEAFDLLADFILSASDTTTSNKPRMRAIGYFNGLLDNQCGNFTINEFIKISGTTAEKVEEGNLAYQFDNLNIQYTGFQFSPKAAFLRNTDQHKAIKLYSDCDFFDFDGKSEREEIDRIYISNCKFENCKINSVHVVSEIKSKAANNLVYLMSSSQQNEFIKCNFSNFFKWSTLCPDSHLSPKKNFKDCYYIKGFFPYSFDSDIFDGYLVEVSSQDEADKRFFLSTY